MPSLVLRDSGWRNQLRRVPNDSVLYLPGLRGGGSVIDDYSGEANNGTITEATWEKLQSGPWYLDFDGSNDEVDCGAGGSLDITSPLTLKVWVKPNGVGELGYIIAKTATGGANSGYSMYWDGAEDKVRLIGTVNGTVGNVRSSSAVFTDNGVWVHTVITVLVDAIKFYRNGVAAGTATDTIPSVAASKVIIGNREGVTHADTNFNGSIAIPSIVEAEWSADEVANNFGDERRFFRV